MCLVRRGARGVGGDLLDTHANEENAKWLAKFRENKKENTALVHI